MNPAYDPQQTRVLRLRQARSSSAGDRAPAGGARRAEPRERGPGAAVRGDARRRRVGHGTGASCWTLVRAAGRGRRGGGATPGSGRRSSGRGRHGVQQGGRGVATPAAPRTRGRRWRRSSTHARARKVDAATWLRIADLAAAIGALTAADDGRRPGGRGRRRRRRSPPRSNRRGTGSRCRSTPRSSACRPNASRPTSPVTGRRRRLIDAGDVAAARARLGELAAAFPDAPGVDGAHLRSRAAGQAPGGRRQAAARRRSRSSRARRAPTSCWRSSRCATHREAGRRAAPSHGDPARPVGSDRLARAGAVLPQHARQPAPDGAGQRAPGAAVVAAARVTA